MAVNYFVVEKIGTVHYFHGIPKFLFSKIDFLGVQAETGMSIPYANLINQTKQSLKSQSIQIGYMNPYFLLSSVEGPRVNLIKFDIQLI